MVNEALCHCQTLHCEKVLSFGLCDVLPVGPLWCLCLLLVLCFPSVVLLVELRSSLRTHLIFPCKYIFALFFAIISKIFLRGIILRGMLALAL